MGDIGTLPAGNKAGTETRAAADVASDLGSKLDLDSAIDFLRHWCVATGLPHVTLTAIDPDGPPNQALPTRTFERTSLDNAREWIAEHQRANLYFQPNETRAECDKRPRKADMVAAVCQHADVDPVDRKGYGAERNRLHNLADALSETFEIAPSCIIDSGNGIQPLWITTREELTADTLIRRIEAENAAIGAELGADSTHHVDRLLRLPGTVNYPNRKKREAGRGIPQAGVLRWNDGASYGLQDAAGLAGWIGAALVTKGLCSGVAQP